MTVSTYSPEDVIVVISGLHTIEGYASGTFLTISKITPVFTARESSDGIVSRSSYRSGSYNISLTLHQSSESNQILSYISRIDEITSAGTFPILIKDGSGSSIFFSAEAWINTISDSSYSDTVESREWNITATNASSNVGGDEQTSSFEDILNVGAGYLGRLL